MRRAPGVPLRRLAGLLALVLLGSACEGGSGEFAGMAPVRPQGSRFVAGGRPWFLATNFLTAGEPRTHLTHTYLAEDTTDAERAAMRSQLREEGHNAIFVYLLNEGDYGSRTTPYRDGLLGGPFDEAKLGRWRARLEELVAAGLRPVLWLFADDSPTVHAASEKELLRYVDAMVARFDDLPVLWVLGLEIDEYWGRPRVELLGPHLAAHTRHPVGVHQRPGRTELMRGPWVGFYAYQYRRDPETRDTAWRAVYEETRRQRERLPQRPFVAAEYAWEVGGSPAAARGLAAAFAGAAGVGNGSPAGLADWMRGLPAGLEPSREGDRLLLSGEGLRALARPEELRFRCEGCPGSAAPAETGAGAPASRPRARLAPGRPPPPRAGGAS